MSKAILVMDMPSCCFNCPLYTMYGEKTCLCKGVYKRLGKTQVYQERAEWCPLKEVPEKANHTPYESVSMASYKNGRNACIDEILGGGE